MGYKANACVNCRQMKLGCDARTAFPAPCQRCSQRGLACTIDPNFQRTSKKQKLRELEQEIEKLKATENGRTGAPSPVSQQSATRSMPEVSPAATSHPSTSLWQPVQLGEVHLNEVAVSEIVEHFFTAYHPIFPVLPDRPEFMQDGQPTDFLLWTIIAIASKSLESYTMYHQMLQPHVRRMASDIYSLHDQPLQAVQALLLLCWWPFSYGATRDEPIWTYNGLAVHLALQHGLHRPHHYSDFVYAAEVDDIRVKAVQRAWAGCAIVNQLTSSYYGIPGTIRPRWSHSIPLPAVLDQYLRIACEQYHICQALGDSEESSSGLLSNPATTIIALESHLKTLEAQLGAPVHTCVELSLSHAKLCLYSFVISSDSMRLSVDATTLLVKANHTAIKVIHLASHSLNQTNWPNIARISVVFAVNTLLLMSTIPGHDQQSVTRNSIGEAWRLIQSRSEFEHDSWSRMAKIIAYLSRVYVANNMSEGTTRPMTVRSRMAANVLFQNAWHAKQRFSRSVHDAKPLDYTVAAALNDLSFLDFADMSFDPTAFNEFTTSEAYSWFAEM